MATAQGNRKLFEREFPSLPGVYRIFDSGDQLIYVGKAKNLRRRLSQYRNAKRRKKHLKMRTLVAEASRVEVETTSSHLEACLLETKLIQSLRPKWNIVGAFSFMYPFVGMRWDGNTLFLCVTTRPELFPDFILHGAFRSRGSTTEAVESLAELMKTVGHPVPRGILFAAESPAKRDRYARVWGYRRLSDAWVSSLGDFWRGRSRDAIEELVLALADSRSARRSPRRVQQSLNALKWFWRHEAQPLARALGSGANVESKTYPIAQVDRDLLFLRYRLRSELHPVNAL